MILQAKSRLLLLFLPGRFIFSCSANLAYFSFELTLIIVQISQMFHGLDNGSEHWSSAT